MWENEEVGYLIYKIPMVYSLVFNCMSLDKADDDLQTAMKSKSHLQAVISANTAFLMTCSKRSRHANGAVLLRVQREKASVWIWSESAQHRSATLKHLIRDMAISSVLWFRLNLKLRLWEKVKVGRNSWGWSWDSSNVASYHTIGSVCVCVYKYISIKWESAFEIKMGFLRTASQPVSAVLEIVIY